MWEKFAGFIAAVITLNETLERNQREIETLQQQQIETHETLKEVIMQICHSREIEQSEREKLALKLEVELLKFENRLPPH